MAMPKQALKNIELLVFDLDGTLADTKQDLAISVNAMRCEMGLGPLTEDLIATYVGRGVAVLFERALGDSVRPEEIERGIKLFQDYYGRHLLDHTVVYPGVREALEQLGDRKLSVLTNKPTGFSRRMLQGLGLAPYFSEIYGGDSFARKKPDPLGVLKLMSEHGALPHKTMMVGDSETDVIAGRSAGAWTCGVTYGFGRKSLEATPPDLLVEDLREVPVLLDGSAAETRRPSD